jgi:hypothetical protein
MPIKLASLADKRQYGWQRIWRWEVIWLALLLALPISGWATTQEAFQAVRYRLEVTYDATARTIQGHTSFTAIWRGAPPLMAIYFFLPPNTLRRRD